VHKKYARIAVAIGIAVFSALLAIGVVSPSMASASTVSGNTKCYSAAQYPSGTNSQATVVTTSNQSPVTGQPAQTTYNVKPPTDCPQPPGCPPRTYNGYQGPPSSGCCMNESNGQSQYGNNDHCPSPPPGCPPGKYQPQGQNGSGCCVVKSDGQSQYGNGCCTDKSDSQYGNNDHCPSPPPSCQPKYGQHGQSNGTACCVVKTDNRYGNNDHCPSPPPGCPPGKYRTQERNGDGCCVVKDYKYGAQPRCTVPVVYRTPLPVVSPNYKCYDAKQAVNGYVFYKGYCYQYSFLSTIDGYQYAFFTDRAHHRHQIIHQYDARKHCYGPWYVV